MAEHHRGSTADEAIARRRSISALVWGWVLLAGCCWVAIDAAIAGDLIAVGAVVVVAGAFFAAMIRPVLVVDEDGLTIRNPLRTICVPWHEVTEITGRLSVEVRTNRRAYTVWAVPVSLRQRGRARRQVYRDAVARDAVARGRGAGTLASSAVPERPWADQVVEELRELLRDRAPTPGGDASPDGVGSPGGSDAPSDGVGPRPGGGGTRVSWPAYPLAVVAVGGALILAGALT